MIVFALPAFLQPPAPLPPIAAPKPTEIDTVIYHKNCVDGFTSALIAWQVLGDKARYIASSYDDSLPDVAGKNVAVLDFHYKPDGVRQLLSTAHTAVLIDHHKSAITGSDSLAGFPNMILDMEHSGAYLTWKFFHPDEPVPDLVRYVQDQDLWKWQLERSRDFFAGVDAVPFDFAAYAQLLSTPKEQIIVRGEAINQRIAKIVAASVEKAAMKKFQGYNAMVVNASIQGNEIADALCLKEGCDLAVIWYYDEAKGVYKVSLRTRGSETSPDVSELAKRLDPQGGGHKNAAGFHWSGKDIHEIFDTAS